MRLAEIDAQNARALAARPCRQPDYEFRPVSAHDADLHRLKTEYPFFGYVEVEVTGVRPFVMMSNDDDVVAQVYFWFGPDSYETLSMRVWRRLCRSSELIVDVGAYTGLFTLVAAFCAPSAELHAFEPDPAAHARLLMNLSVNRLGQRVSVHEVAASNRRGSAVLHGFQGSLNLTTGSSLRMKENKRVERSREVVTARLDEVLPQDMRHVAVKIDAEEVEDRVIEGLQGIVADRQVSLLVEVSSRALLEECRRQLPMHSFAVLDDVGRRAMVNDAERLDERDRLLRGYGRVGDRLDPLNVLFHPGGAGNLMRWLEPLVAEASNHAGPEGVPIPQSPI